MHDGSAWRKAKQIHVHDGSAWRDVKKAYIHDGSAWRQVFQKEGSWVQIGSIGLEAGPNKMLRFNNQLYVVSGGNVHVWNGSSFSQVGSLGTVTALKATAAWLFVLSAGAVYRWDGSSWVLYGNAHYYSDITGPDNVVNVQRVFYVQGPTYFYSLKNGVEGFIGGWVAVPSVGEIPRSSTYGYGKSSGHLYAFYDNGTVVGSFFSMPANTICITDTGVNVFAISSAGVYRCADNGSFTLVYNTDTPATIRYNPDTAFSPVLLTTTNFKVKQADGFGSTWTDISSTTPFSGTMGEACVVGGILYAGCTNGIYQWVP